ncbi:MULTISPECIES: twin-arginine translocase subunit TatC [Atopobiaceae]|uniref:Sec-independent protein translocase protein TatC n=1 Tax=Parafannyhessea umbonata TaxID=604330 RepID=A0A1H9MZV0_9ACTN|nr:MULTISPECIES: twin-arginine translocase subunit TatC [Atopobiaceae]SEH36423.1 sec-independent protein translocase protein TatC [Parafannyhessea umbonata]SER29057.1 sec-independent protein translocase protein TatC [Parafannyhessea umbonata]SJZ38040.1 sec-independent protein translocase protein TatC [Olsenella sp. KH1P3]
MPIGPARMPLMDHLGELRRRLTIIVVSLIITAVVVYAATPTLIDIMIDPIRSSLPEGTSLTVLSVLGGFTIRFKVALFFGMIICTPIIIWEVMAFFLPALKPNERKWVVPTVAAMVALFFLGMIFCYFIIQNAAVGWMIDQSTEFAGVIADAVDYLNIMMMLEIGFGLAFQLPLVIFYLSILHLVPYKTFRSQWRYIYVGLMILSGVVTPDASPVTMVLMFAALISLYEVALAVARYVLIARDGKESLKWTREEYSDHKYEQEMANM